MNYTKGNWKVEIIAKRIFIDAPVFTIAELRTKSSLKEHMEESVANANLISAAPDMYQFLKLFKQCLSEDAKATTIDAIGKKSLDHLCDEILAKAEGK